MVNFAREIKDGKLTGRIFSPVVLTGYVPDLLKSITMMSDNIELGGCGACGKGYKEWVKVFGRRSLHQGDDSSGLMKFGKNFDSKGCFYYDRYY